MVLHPLILKEVRGYKGNGWGQRRGEGCNIPNIYKKSMTIWFHNLYVAIKVGEAEGQRGYYRGAQKRGKKNSSMSGSAEM